MKVGDALVKPTPLPTALAEAAKDIGELMGLAPGWFNAGPASLLDLGLPDGFLGRTIRREYGGLVIHLASRLDQICFKVYAAADDSPRGKHFADLKQLAPTPDELRAAAAWVITHDNSGGFREILNQVLAALGAT
jgi:hypothetical protein